MIESVSLVDNLQFNRLVIIPNAVQGLFKRRARAVEAATRAGVDGAAVRFLAGLRNRHDGAPVWVRVVTDRVLLLLDVEDIRTVLEGSPAPFASDPEAKRKGMGHFQPHALTLSRGDMWRERRDFAESVLDTQKPRHRCAEQFDAIVAGEIADLMKDVTGPKGGKLEFDAWHYAWRRIMRRVILGDAAAADEELTDRLSELMAEANGMPDSRSDRFAPFMAHLRSYVETDEPGGLAGLIAGAPSTDETAVSGQVVHWLFAAGDTLPANAFRALALLSAHDDARERALQDDAWMRASLHEAMRLWPTTPMLSRETVGEVELGGETIPAGTQVLFVNTFHHRDHATVPYADRFAPEEWVDGDAGARWGFNHLSHGPQGCPGTNLALALGSAGLRSVLSDRDVELRSGGVDAAKPMPHMLDYFRLRFRVGSVDG